MHTTNEKVSIMQKKARIYSIILVVILSLSVLTGCGNRKKLIGLISEFENGCNSMDVKAVLKTIDPRVANKYRIGVNIIEFFSGKSSDDMLGSVFSALPDEIGENGEEILKSITFDIEEVDVGDEDAEVITTMEYEIMGESYKRQVMFRCVYYIDDWYISSIEFI